MTFDQIIEKCIGLRAAFERDEARFFLGLVDVERRHMDLLRANGYGAFESFVDEIKLCRPARYRAFANGLALIDPERAERMGAPAVIALAANRDRTKVPEYEAAVAAWTAEHKGLTPRLETAERMLRKVDPRPEVPQALKASRQKDSELEQLREENRTLRAENKALKRKLARFEAKAA